MSSRSKKIDLIFNFFWIRIPEQKKYRNGSKTYLLKENLKIMCKDRQSMKKVTISYQKIDGKFLKQRCLESGSGSGLEKIMDPDPVCPERLDPDRVNIRPNPIPCNSPLRHWHSISTIPFNQP